jgi:hypothetical protein
MEINNEGRQRLPRCEADRPGRHLYESTIKASSPTSRCMSGPPQDVRLKGAVGIMETGLSNGFLAKSCAEKGQPSLRSNLNSLVFQGC